MGPDIRALGRKLLPPFAADLVRPLVRGRRPLQFEGDFATFAEALAAAGGAGYEAPQIIEGTITRTERLRREAESGAAATAKVNGWTMQNLAAILSAFGGRLPESLRVLDFGGAMGVHYFALARRLGQTRLTWIVAETKSTAAAATRFANDELQFVNDTAALGAAPDLILCSGSLQYVDDPFAHLDRLLGLCDRVIFNRMPLVEGPRSRLTIQNAQLDIYTARYPAWFLSEPTFREHLARNGFSPRLRWSVPEDSATLDGQTFPYQGLLVMRDAAV